MNGRDVTQLSSSGVYGSVQSFAKIQEVPR
jgi:hypothetical protein